MRSYPKPGTPTKIITKKPIQIRNTIGISCKFDGEYTVQFFIEQDTVIFNDGTMIKTSQFVRNFKII